MAAEVFHPGEYLRDELEARGIGLAEFAKTTRIPIGLLKRLTEGRADVHPSLAHSIASALGQCTGTWMNLQDAYDAGKGVMPVDPAGSVDPNLVQPTPSPPWRRG